MEDDMFVVKSVSLLAYQTCYALQPHELDTEGTQKEGGREVLVLGTYPSVFDQFFSLEGEGGGEC